MAATKRKRPGTRSNKRRDRRQPSIQIAEELRGMMVPLAEIIEQPDNVQVHTEDDVKRFVRVIRRFGWTAPCVLWQHNGKRIISAGHLRYRGAKAAGMLALPAVVNKTWTEAEFRAYTIADNALTKSAPWHIPNLRAALIDLDTGEFPLDLTGWNSAELELLLHGDPAVKDDELSAEQLSEIAANFEQRAGRNAGEVKRWLYFEPEDDATMNRLTAYFGRKGGHRLVAEKVVPVLMGVAEGMPDANEN